MSVLILRGDKETKELVNAKYINRYVKDEITNKRK